MEFLGHGIAGALLHMLQDGKHSVANVRDGLIGSDSLEYLGKFCVAC